MRGLYEKACRERCRRGLCDMSCGGAGWCAEVVRAVEELKRKPRR